MASSKKAPETSPDVPIFLRKTYHMVDSCKPEICSWSEDGETFVVKDPVKFEKTIIPQFFKHSKFSSFVRQLNFYSFRKIKYVDSIRIDPKLEAETANFWRFRHENFRRGRPDLLTEIKRMNGQKGADKKDAKVPVTTSPASNADVAALKKRIEEMNKNINELTALVEKVNLKQEEQEKAKEEVVGTKRKKTELEASPLVPVSAPEVRPDDMVSSMQLDDLPGVPLPDPMPLSRDLTSDTNQTDNEFVDQLFNEFGDDNAIEFLNLEEPEKDSVQPNRPDPELMQRLSDALSVLPRDIQEMIVNRLILSITSPSFEKGVMLSEKESPSMAAQIPVTEEETPSKEVAIPLAAATMAALLQHLYNQTQGEPKLLSSKTLPVIPAHA